jgi:hypothetical protein
MWDAFHDTAQRTVTSATVEAGDKKGGGVGGAGGGPGEYKVASKTLREMLKVYWEVLQVIIVYLYSNMFYLHSNIYDLLFKRKCSRCIGGAGGTRSQKSSQ